MIQNSTITEVAEQVLNDYDNKGAMIYIIIVLLWYSIGILFMLGMQMRARSEFIEDSARRRTKLLIRNLRDHTNTKEILEELVDKQNRAKLWDIYLGTKFHTKDKITHAETVRIRHIEKQLATMNRSRRLTNETLYPPETEIRYFRSRSDSRQIPQDSSPIEPPSTLRRGSSFDQQALERWKILSNQSKTNEQMPWNIRKLMIGRYFRRHAKKRLSIIHQNSNDLIQSNEENLIPSSNNVTRHESDLNLNQIPKFDEKQNPYLTYFYSPTHRPSILTSEFFPVSSEHSIE